MALELDEGTLLGANPENLARLGRSMGLPVDASLGKVRLARIVAGQIETESALGRRATKDEVDTALLAAEHARARRATR